MVFEKSELVADIKHRAYIIAKSATEKSETSDRDDNWLIDIANGEELTREPAGRFMSMAFLEAYTMVSAVAADEDSGNYVENDVYTEVSHYIMRLQVRDIAKQFQIRALHDFIHEYIIYKTLLLWCEMVDREYSEFLEGRVATLEGQVKTALRPLTADDGERPLFPFG